MNPSPNFTEITEILSSLFLDIAASVAQRVHDANLPSTVEVEQIAIQRSSLTAWSTSRQSVERSILTVDTFAEQIRPCLSDADIASVFRCSELIASISGANLPFWVPFAGNISFLVENVPDEYSTIQSYEQHSRNWIARCIVLPALQHNLLALQNVANVSIDDATNFAKQVLHLTRNKHLNYLVQVPLSGIALAPSEASEFFERDIRVRRLTDVEQGEWLGGMFGVALEGLSDREPPQIAVEIAVDGPRDAQHMQEDTLAPQVIAALQLHGYYPAGHYCIQYPDPRWVSPTVSRVPLNIPGRSNRPSTLTSADFRNIVHTAIKLQGYRLREPRSTKDLALHRFTFGLSREDMTDAVLDFTIVLEALLLPYDRNARRGDLGYRFRMHGAHYLAVDANERKTIADKLSSIYEMRSRLVHGDRYPSREQIKLTCDSAEELARRALLKAVNDGFPDAAKFNRLLLGIVSDT